MMGKKERNKSVRLAMLKRRLAAKKLAREIDGARALEILDGIRRVDRRAA